MASAQEAIATILQTGNFGTLGSSIFIDYKPPTPLACIVVTGYEGGDRLRGIGSRTAIAKVSKVQVLVRNPTHATALSTATSIADYLDALTNTTADGVTVFSAFLASGPMVLGKDSNGAVEYSINFKITWR